MISFWCGGEGGKGGSASAASASAIVFFRLPIASASVLLYVCHYHACVHIPFITALAMLLYSTLSSFPMSYRQVLFAYVVRDP